jgi:hypothetical protein
MNTKAAKPLMFFVRMFGAVAGTFGFGAAAGVVALPRDASAQENRFESPWNAPLAWQTFAARVQARFHELLSAENDAARLVQTRLAEQGSTSEEKLSVLARVWVEPSGVVTRLEFDTPDQVLDADLRAVLMNNDVGAPLPSGMLQPLHLKLFLDQSR